MIEALAHNLQTVAIICASLTVICGSLWGVWRKVIRPVHDRVQDIWNVVETQLLPSEGESMYSQVTTLREEVVTIRNDVKKVSAVVERELRPNGGESMRDDLKQLKRQMAEHRHANEVAHHEVVERLDEIAK